MTGQEGPQSPRFQLAFFPPSQFTHQGPLEVVSLVHNPHLHLGMSLSSTFLERWLCLLVWPSVCGFRAYIVVFHHLPSLSIGATNSRAQQMATGPVKLALTSSSHIPRRVPLMVHRGFKHQPTSPCTYRMCVLCLSWSLKCCSSLVLVFQEGKRHCLGLWDSGVRWGVPGLSH